MAGLIGPFAMAKLGLSVFGIQAGSAMASTGLLGKALGGLSTSLSGLGAAWQAASLGTVLTALPGRLKAAASAAKAWVASAGSALVGSFRAAGSSALAFATAPLRWVIKGLREAALAAWMNIRVNGLLGASWNGIKAGGPVACWRCCAAASPPCSAVPPAPCVCSGRPSCSRDVPCCSTPSA
ncbi:hypothetical protein ACFS3C_19155 [Azotobacter vinelandii]